MLAHFAPLFPASGVPALNGPTRICLYGLLQIHPGWAGWHTRAASGNPWSVADQGASWKTRSVGVLSLLPAAAHEWALSRATLRGVRWVAHGAFTMAALGFGGHIPVVVAAVTWFWLTNACVSKNHDVTALYVVPTWTLLLLCVSSARHELSVDALLDGWVAHYPFPPVDPAQGPWSQLLCSNVGPTLAFYQLTWMLTGAGVSKLRRSWGPGKWWFRRLPEFIDLCNAHERKGSWPWLSNLLRQHPSVCMLLMLGALGLELTALAANAIPGWRVPLILSLTSMHVGIAIVMSVVFSHHAMCYLVFVDWHAALVSWLGWSECATASGGACPWYTSPACDCAGGTTTSRHSLCFANMDERTQMGILVFFLVSTSALAASTTICPFEFFPLSECCTWSGNNAQEEARLQRQRKAWAIARAMRTTLRQRATATCGSGGDRVAGPTAPEAGERAART